MSELEEIRAIEARAADAWPAEPAESLDGWQPRSSGGGYRRRDSAATPAAAGTQPVEPKLDRARVDVRARAERRLEAANARRARSTGRPASRPSMPTPIGAAGTARRSRRTPRPQT